MVLYALLHATLLYAVHTNQTKVKIPKRHSRKPRPRTGDGELNSDLCARDKVLSDVALEGLVRAQVQEGGDPSHLVGRVLRTPPSGAHLVSGATASRAVLRTARTRKPTQAAAARRPSYLLWLHLPWLHILWLHVLRHGLLWHHAHLPPDAGRSGKEADDHNVPYARRHPAWLGLG